MNNNVWGQLVSHEAVPALAAPVSAQHRLRETAEKAYKRRRPEGYRAAKIKPTKPCNTTAINSVTATPANPWLLTSHQYTAVAMMSQGASRKAVAKELGISYKTLNAHLTRVREKMSVSTVEEAVAEWLRVNMKRDLEQRRTRADETLLFNLRKMGIKLP